MKKYRLTDIVDTKAIIKVVDTFRSKVSFEDGPKIDTLVLGCEILYGEINSSDKIILLDKNDCIISADTSISNTNSTRDIIALKKFKDVLNSIKYSETDNSFGLIVKEDYSDYIIGRLKTIIVLKNTK